MEQPEKVENIQELHDRLSRIIDRLKMPNAPTSGMSTDDGVLLATSILFLARELDKPTKWNRGSARPLAEAKPLPAAFIPTLPLYVVAQADKKNLSYIQSGGLKACVMCTEELPAERWRDEVNTEWIVFNLEHHETVVRFLEQLKEQNPDVTHVAFDPKPLSEPSKRTVLLPIDEVIAWAKKQ
jgi:hypothetical protein